MKRLQLFLQDVSAWQVRIVALACIVLSIAGGSHLLVNALATAETSEQTNYAITTSVSIPMHVAHSQHVVFHVSSKGNQPVGASTR